MILSDNKNSAGQKEATSLNPDATLDLRGKKCPMTFVYTKLELEKLKAGQILKVVLNYPPSFVNVPRSVNLQDLGVVVRETPEHNGEKTLWICKKIVFK